MADDRPQFRPPEEHYRLAEVWLDNAERIVGLNPDEADHYTRIAQVHATLATVHEVTAGRADD